MNINDEFDRLNGTQSDIVDNLEDLVADTTTQSSNFDRLNGTQETIISNLEDLVADAETSKEYFSDIARGLNPTANNFKKAGGSNSIGTAQKMVNWTATDFNAISAASQVTFISTSASDTALGTGARSILITGINASGAEQTEILALNGLSNVVSANSYTKLLNRVQVYTAGSALGNVGTITGTAEAKTVCTIPPNYSLMKQCGYSVPTGKTALIHSYFIDVSKNASADKVIDIYFYVLRNGVKYALFQHRINQSNGQDVFVDRYYKTPVPIEQGSTWWIEAKIDSGTLWIDIEVEQTIHDN